MINEDDVIRMAWEVWLTPHNGYVGPSIKGLERFAALVAAKEREACAKVCNALQDCGPENGCCPTSWNEALEKAEAVIRARENT